MSNIIEYKNYIGSVEYSNEDKCFFGKLEMIDDLVTFEATNVEELESNFKQSVDDYINTCVELDRAPQKTYKGVFPSEFFKFGSHLFSNNNFTIFKNTKFMGALILPIGGGI